MRWPGLEKTASKGQDVLMVPLDRKGLSGEKKLEGVVLMGAHGARADWLAGRRPSHARSRLPSSSG